MATIDYMVASYGPYSASATGGNALARDFLAGVAALYAGPCKSIPTGQPRASAYAIPPVYSNIPNSTLEWPSTILAFLALLVTIPIYVFYWKGPAIRERSKFAQTLASDKQTRKGRGVVNEKESTQPKTV